MNVDLSLPVAVPRSRREIALWVGWSLIVCVAVACDVWALHVLVDVPRRLTPWWLTGLFALPLSSIAIAVPSFRARAAVTLAVTAQIAGLISMVLGVYLVVVVGLGQDVTGSEHRVLGLSMLAALIAVVLAGPIRSRLQRATEVATGRDHRPATAALETFGTRMTRAVPMDELLLQLAESLRATMAPAGAEVWTGEDGELERSVSVPDRGPSHMRLVGAELAAVTGARVSGSAWAAMWLPGVVDGRDFDGTELRIAPITHLGKLHGLIVVTRNRVDGDFRTADEAALSDLARQVGLALHNVRLDSALQRSLDELKSRNAELQASRARVVSAADASRRRIERDLHDGAQQHLVALAVKLRLAAMKAQKVDTSLVPELEDLHDEVQTTIAEVRELAHGIYPPLLRDRGLAGALRHAASRSPLSVTVDVSIERFDPDIEAAVYFCCLEAMQNAAKYAGDGATITIRIIRDGATLVFEVVDDGAGFDPTDVGESHGFANMRDRVGAHGGELTVVSGRGDGTMVRGELPIRGDGP